MNCPTCNREMVITTDEESYVCLSCCKVLPAEPRKRSKYNNQRAEYNGVWYDSKKEAAFAQELDLKRKAGEIAWWCRQPQFVLPGGVIYKPDFIYVDQIHLVPFVVDVKGVRTQEYKLKKKQVEAIYNVRIEER